MATFKLAKKDAVSDTRTNIYDLHEKKIEYFESEKNKLDEYIKLLDKLKKTSKKFNNVTNERYKLNTQIDDL